MRLWIWKADEELCSSDAEIEVLGRSVMLTAYLPEGLSAARVTVKVSVVGGPLIEQTTIEFDPQRD